MAKHLFIVTLLAMGVFFFLGVVFQILQHRRKPAVRYICDRCGEHDCMCHKAATDVDPPPKQADSPMSEKEDRP